MATLNCHHYGHYFVHSTLLGAWSRNYIGNILYQLLSVNSEACHLDGEHILFNPWFINRAQLGNNDIIISGILPCILSQNYM